MEKPMRCSKRFIVVALALVMGPVFVLGTAAMGVFVLVKSDPFILGVLMALMMFALAGFIAYQMSRTYHWVEWEGATIRGRKFWSRRLVEQKLDDLTEIVPLQAMVQNAPETHIIDSVTGTSNRGYELRFREGTVFWLIRGDMIDVDGFVAALHRQRIKLKRIAEGGEPLTQTWDRIEAWLAANAPLHLAGLNPPASPQAIAATEQLLGVRFPDDVRASYLRHDGQQPDAPWLLEDWEWLSLERIQDEWTVWKDLLEAGSFADTHSETDGQIVRRDWWHPAWIPLTYSGSGDHHCLDLAPGPRGKNGQILIIWHDIGERPVVASSFSDWLCDFADRLEDATLTVSDPARR